MKNLIKLIVLFAFSLGCTIAMNGQVHKDRDEMISFVVTQDVKLATIEDDYGNQPFTPDVRVTMLWKGLQTDYGNLEIRIGFEYADLSVTKYIRYSGGVGYSFNHMIIPFVKTRYCVAPFINYGVINRGGNSATQGAFEFGADVKLPISKRAKIVSTFVVTDRNDIGRRLNTWENVADNFSWGLGLEIIVL